ncbi:MAG TPA: hypothetical protein VF017_08905 [Thermoanaerobaculia bacterium]|nr:hypothetical protein [Thermoanaerobaculia bacterium]
MSQPPLRLISLVALTAALLASSACGKVAEVAQRAQEAKRAAQPAKPKAPPVNYFEGDHAAKAVAQLAEKLGAPIKALEISVYTDSVRLQVQDPNKLDNVDEYRVRNGVVGDPIPVRLFGGGNLEENLYQASDVRFDLIPQLITRAGEEIDLEGEEITHVIVKRRLPFSRGVRIRVFVDGTRKSGSLDADSDGKVIEIDRG